MNNPEREMSLVDHLDELRTRIIICLAALTLCTVAGFFVAKPILMALTGRTTLRSGEQEVLTLHVRPDGVLYINPPLTPEKVSKLTRRQMRFVWDAEPGRDASRMQYEYGDRPTQFFYSNPVDPFMLPFKIAFIVGVLLALPVFIWQTWLFISPGLTGKERQVIKPMLIGSIVLFPLGAFFAYFMVQLVLVVMRQYAVENVEPLLNIYEYLSLMATMMIVFGIIFEMPVLLAGAARVGLVQPAFMRRYRRHIYVVLAVAAMLFTPADGLTMIMVLIPLIGLFELSIVVVNIMYRLRQREIAVEPVTGDAP